jgi:hypothetical protein
VNLQITRFNKKNCLVGGNMFNQKVDGSGRKSAGVTLELILAITLAVVVLFFILSLVGDDLKTMVASGRISNMFVNGQKTTYNNQAFDPTQVNVQVLAEQGNTFQTLADAQNQAIDKIKGYLTNPPQNADQVMDLAKWLTIAKTTVSASALSQQGISVSTLAGQYGITINNSGTNFSTSVGTAKILANSGSVTNYTQLPINKQFTYSPDVTVLTASDNQLAAANQIITAQYK